MNPAQPKNFLSYHFAIALPAFIASRPKKLASEFEFLNITGLILHLFSPYRRLTIDKKASIIDKLSFDLISRLIGAIVRVLLIILGLFIFLVFTFAYIWAIVFYILPLFSLLNYLQYKNSTFFKEDLESPQKFLDKLEGSDFFKSLCLFFEDDFIKLLKSLPSPQTIGITSDLNLSQMVTAISQNWKDLKNYLATKNIQEQQLMILTDFIDTFYTTPTFQKPAPIGRDLIYGYTNTLDSFSHEVTNQQITNPYFNKNLVEKLENILTKPKANNAILVGDVGVGKHSSIENLASAVTRQQLPKLKDKRIIFLDTIALISSSKNLIDIKNTFEMLLSEAKHAGNIILAIDEIDKVTSSQDSRIDLTEIFTEILTEGSLPIIGITTLENFHKFIRPNLNFLRLFDKVDVEEPTKEELPKILISKSLAIYKKQNVATTFQGILEIIEKSDRLIPEKKQPEKSISILENCLIRAQKLSLTQITLNTVDEIFSEITKIPIGRIKQTEIEKLKDLESYLHKRIVGQDEAISQIAKAMRRSRTGLDKSKRPMGSFLFLGPTGVGKTETAKALADAYFGKSSKMIRLDMTEYQSNDSVIRLTGDTTSKNPGILTSLVRQNPFGLLLLDEFEKANPYVQNLFLQIFDEGILTDAFNKTVSFTNIIIIATSNAGAEFIREEVKKSEVQPHNEVEPQKNLSLSTKLIEYILSKGLFNPELINRFDGVIVYQPLTKQQIIAVAKLMLNEFAAQIKDTKNITLEINDTLAIKVAELGFNVQFGARPIRRLIADKIGDGIARMLLNNQISEGSKIPSSTLMEFLI